MMQNSIELIYIDDNPETFLQHYLDEFEDTLAEGDSSKHLDMQLNFSWGDVPWESEYTYSDLFKMDKVRDAEIILIDSNLVVSGGPSLTGEQIKILFKQTFPFKKVFVLSQQESPATTQFIKKYKAVGTGSREEARENSKVFYDQNFKPYLNKAIEQIKDEREILKTLSDSGFVDEYQLERVEDSMNGEANVELLEKAEIDDLINVVKELVGDGL